MISCDIDLAWIWEYDLLIWLREVHSLCIIRIENQFIIIIIVTLGLNRIRDLFGGYNGQLLVVCCLFVCIILHVWDRCKMRSIRTVRSAMDLAHERRG